MLICRVNLADSYMMGHRAAATKANIDENFAYSGEEGDDVRIQVAQHLATQMTTKQGAMGREEAII